MIQQLQEWTSAMIQRDPWQATAAYFYLLQLDSLALAWEYLRRNTLYRSDWEQAAERVDAHAGLAWGLRWP